MGIFKTKPINPNLTPLAESFNEFELERLSELSTIVNIKAGAVLAREGAVGQEAVVVLSGTACVERDGEVIATVGEATVLGEGALITGEARTATLVAQTDLTVSVLNRREFNSWLADCPRVKAEIEGLAAARS